METYLSLRILQSETLRSLSTQISIGDWNFTPIQVSISQFYGMGINDFALTAAKTALWAIESQTMKKIKEESP